MRIGKLWKAFFVENIYCVGYRYAGDSFAYEEKNAEFVMQTLDWKKWCADPIICDAGDKTYVFVEEMNRMTNRAHISVMTLDRSDGMSLPKVAIKEPFHMSFPETFVKGQKRYMIPETSEVGEMRIYRCDGKTDKWKMVCSFPETCIDIAIMEQGGDVYCIASQEHPKNRHKTKLKIYMLDVMGESLKECNQMETDCEYSYSARNGGKIIIRNGEYYRVAQRSTKEFYGKCVDIFRINRFEETKVYQEHKIAELSVEDLKLKYKNRFYKPIGMHTYGHVNGWEVIDVNTEHFSVLVPFQKMMRVMNRKRMQRK